MRHVYIQDELTPSSFDLRRDALRQLNGRWITKVDVTFCDHQMIDVTVPAGFKTDLASIPTLLQPLMGGKRLYDLAGLIHDVAYARGYDKDVADALFKMVARSQDVGRARAKLGMYGVRLFGWPAYLRHVRRRRREAK